MEEMFPLELPAVTVPSFVESRLQRGELLGDVSGARVLVALDLADGNELVGEAPRRVRLRPAPLRLERERVLVLARDAPRSATFSPVSPIDSSGNSSSILGFGKRQPSVVSQIVWLPRGNACSGFAITSGARVIDSTPPATKRSPSPAITAWQRRRPPTAPRRRAG